ncbi:flagellar hook-length control protein FliK [Caminicella sporogenes]|uniref:flagellar hook-length control protein FliK n=1 Tax=Caminicella sporogenes TaxID=166485 RepID=UPI0025406A13|nr:flagellar hook-length control protein FliK [Caminicella sporogenes]WIF94638.1 flagellar hook-length control protein FliK [Caminicella sporogenes]
MLNRKIRKDLLAAYDSSSKLNDNLNCKKSIKNSKNLNTDNKFKKILSKKTDNNDKKTIDEKQGKNVSDADKKENKQFKNVNVLMSALGSIIKNINISDEKNIHEREDTVKAIEKLLSQFSLNGEDFNINYILNEIKKYFSDNLNLESIDFEKVKSILIDIQQMKDVKSDKEISDLYKLLDELQEILKDNKTNTKNTVQNLKDYQKDKSLKNFTVKSANSIKSSNELEEDKNITSNSNDLEESKKIVFDKFKESEENEKTNSKNLFKLGIIRTKSSNISEKHDLSKVNEFINTGNSSIENEKVINGVKSGQFLKNNNLELGKIFNQIIENAKTYINDDNSQITIKLKPDFLGNLSMKIIVERGILIAKFDVESQIVKQAIEANLEDLRNALSEKGFEIKEFSVSVNQDSSYNQSTFDRYKGKKVKKVVLNEEQLEKNYMTNQTYLNGLNSTINYLA